MMLKQSLVSARTLGALGAALVVVASACGDGGSGGPDAAPAIDAAPPDSAVDAAIAPALRNPVDLPDTELATQALQLLGANVGSGGQKNCNACHGLTKQRLFQWRAMSDTSLSSCLTDLQVSTSASALQMINCLREDPDDDTSSFMPSKLGVYSSATHLGWFEFVFWRAYGDDARDKWGDFINRVGMPKGGRTPFDQGQLDIVAEWFARGLPSIDTVLPNDPPPTECTPGISADVAMHATAMKMMGWGAVNSENNILMHGCQGAASPTECLTSYPLASTTAFGSGWEHLSGAKLRVLHTFSHVSSFWTRSSADGRFVAHGAKQLGQQYDSAIIDLGDSNRVIPTTAYYDPAFFPDNSGFVFQGWRAFMCGQSVLTGMPTDVRYDEAQCSTTRRIGLYEHVGAALGGGDYWAVDGQFENDNHGFDPHFTDPDTSFSSGADISLTPMVHDGNNYTAQPSIDVPSPFEGDAVLSHSARLVVTRLAGPGDKQLGFVLRRVDATPDGNGGYDIALPEIARYCTNGSKPDFSFDERWMVIHHYIGDDDAVSLGFTGADDPAFAEYKTKGAANVYLLDLLSGAVTRVTHMAAGQYALFPHFRSDGWIYFVVRTAGSDEEHLVASDAALVLEANE